MTHTDKYYEELRKKLKNERRFSVLIKVIKDIMDEEREERPGGLVPKILEKMRKPKRKKYVIPEA